MFTGIIQELGRVKSLRRRGRVYELTVIAGVVSKDAGTGDSISVNGVCLTVVKKRGEDEIIFEIMDESIIKTNLGRLRSGDKVNLEPSLKLGDRVGGHMLSGHIDGVGRVRKAARYGETCEIQIGIPIGFKRFIVPKGSVAVDGISLTVVKVGQDWFSVSIIPHTLKNSTLGLARAGAAVNIELDLMAKYAQNAPIQKI